MEKLSNNSTLLELVDQLVSDIASTAIVQVLNDKGYHLDLIEDDQKGQIFTYYCKSDFEHKLLLSNDADYLTICLQPWYSKYQQTLVYVEPSEINAISIESIKAMVLKAI